jgi:hypothetical protein
MSIRKSHNELRDLSCAQIHLLVHGCACEAIARVESSPSHAAHHARSDPISRKSVGIEHSVVPMLITTIMQSPTKPCHAQKHTMFEWSELLVTRRSATGSGAGECLFTKPFQLLCPQTLYIVLCNSAGVTTVQCIGKRMRSATANI